MYRMTKASKSSSSRSAPAELAMAFGSGFVVTAALLGIVQAVRYIAASAAEDAGDGTTITNDDNSGVAIGAATGSPNISSDARFPWEPQPSHDTKDASSSINVRSKPTTDRQEESASPSVSTKDQLRFLSQMSFANGGIRAPSCPCCF